MDPAEIEFLAEKESIEIVPNFTHGVMHLIQGDVGPFRPGLPVSVPLWLAVNLRQRQRCRMVRPNWMAVDRLEEVCYYLFMMVETEQESSDCSKIMLSFLLSSGPPLFLSPRKLT